MNNYCTNCGKKLNEHAIKCDVCNTYVIDLKVVNKKKILYAIFAIIIVIIIGIIIGIISYIFYYNNLYKSLSKNYLENDYGKTEYVGHEYCRQCDSSCEGGCSGTRKIVGCFKYYYKTDTSLDKPDIVVYSDHGEVSVDSYSTIINKYGADEYYHEDDLYYLTKKRKDLNIFFEELETDDIEYVYYMVEDIIELYRKNSDEELRISITYDYDKDEEKDGNMMSGHKIYIDNGNFDDYNPSSFEWRFDDYTEIINPSLKQVINKISQTKNKQNDSDRSSEND